ncbi:TPA: hypothetical protein LVL13_004482 [Klebsiella oxytoca]|nr:hypothetical protein [Klebsiella oxytoca]
MGDKLKNLFQVLENLAPSSVKHSHDGRTVILIGWHLEEFNQPSNDQYESNQIKDIPNKTGVPWMPRYLASRTVKGIQGQHLLIRVIHPFAKTPKEKSRGYETCDCCGVRGKEPGAVEKKNKSAYQDHNFVPVIQGKFGERVLHFLSRFFR